MRLARFDELTYEILADIRVRRDANDNGYVFNGLVVREDGMLLGSASTVHDEVVVASLNPLDGTVELVVSVEVEYAGTTAITRHRGSYYLCVSEPGEFSSDPDALHVWRFDPVAGDVVPSDTYIFSNPIMGAVLVPENPADRALPYGDLDVTDAITFLVSFSKEEAEADLAEPYGVHDYEDVIGFLHAFERGYP